MIRITKVSAMVITMMMLMMIMMIMMMIEKLKMLIVSRKFNFYQNMAI